MEIVKERGNEKCSDFELQYLINILVLDKV